MSFPYNSTEKENISCNFCGGNDYKILSKKGTDDLDLISVICKKCGLIFINPRMKKEGYALYYEKEYRDKTINNGAGGSGFSCERLHETTKKHGEALANMFLPFLKVKGDIMEVGSGVGGVLAGIKKVTGRKVYGIEPSGQEASYASSVGIETYHALIEDFTDRENKFAVVLSTQSLNHFLDPKYFFVWAHDCLVKDGLLIVEVMNFRHQLKKSGLFKNSVKIDHVYMFTPEVLKAFIESSGFEILHCDVDEYVKKEKIQGIPRVHIRIVARKLNLTPFKNLSTPKDLYSKTLGSLNKFKIYMYYLLHSRLANFFKKRV